MKRAPNAGAATGGQLDQMLANGAISQSVADRIRGSQNGVSPGRANVLSQFGDPNGILGGGSGSSSTVAQSGTGVTDSLREKFESTLSNNLDSRDVANVDPQERIGRAFEGIAQNEESASLGLQRNAAATGFGVSGGVQKGLRNVAEGFAGLRADTSRDITGDVANENAAAQGREDNRLLQSLGLAGQAIESSSRLSLAEREFADRQEARQDSIRRNRPGVSNGRSKNRFGGRITGASGFSGPSGKSRPNPLQNRPGPSMMQGGFLDEIAKRQNTGAPMTDRLRDLANRGASQGQQKTAPELGSRPRPTGPRRAPPDLRTSRINSKGGRA